MHEFQFLPEYLKYVMQFLHMKFALDADFDKIQSYLTLRVFLKYLLPLWILDKIMKHNKLQ